MHRKLLPAVLSIGMLAGISAWAQSTDASLSGTVTDPSGAPIANATVIAEHISTGVATTTKTNESGVYLFPALPPGIYRLTGEREGFRRFVYDKVELTISARVSLNMALELGATSESVEVKAQSDTELGYANSSVGSILTGRKLLELPLAGRSVFDLISTQAGTSGSNGGQNFNGARSGSLNVTIDGVNAQDNLLNNLFNAFVAASVSVDRVAEFRLVTSPADAELGRGSGQIQMITRSGTNGFHGSLFEEHRNTALTANSWFNNARGNDPKTGLPISPRNFLIRNQYGGRIGGPIRKNQTFFNFNYEGQRQRSKDAVTSTVYTAAAREGIFRFFPGARNANSDAAIPTVDLQGNPVRPPTATGDLQSVPLFGRDPSRPGPDPTGIIAKQLELIPLPNNFRVGDGLNTAGFTWKRRVTYDFGEWDLRLDHMFTAQHRLSFSYSHQGYESLNVCGPQALPKSEPCSAPTDTSVFSLGVTSVLRSNLLNEVRAGVLRPRVSIIAPYQVGGTDVLPRSGNQPYLLSFSLVTSPFYPSVSADPSSRISPVYQIGDNLTWLKGRHAFKGGGEVRYVSSAGFDQFGVLPRATLGPGSVAVQNINNITGIGVNNGTAQQLLAELAGSLNGAGQTLNSPGGKNPVFLPGQSRYRNWRQHEFDWFFKDDFKVTPNLTLNLGVRYEWYAVPYEGQGRALALVGGESGIFGISGTSFASLFHPSAANGKLTQIQPIGSGTVNPGIKLYQNDNNNFAPAVGLSWNLPWLGKNKTVLRVGYGMGYERNPIYLTHTVSALEPGYSTTPLFTSASLITIGSLPLPIPPDGPPLATVPLTDRSQTVYAFDDHLRTPYYQNWNISIQRALTNNTLLELRYVGNKGSKLIRDINLNEANIFENGILDAFRLTQAGGNSPLLDRIFLGLNIPGLGVVDGTKITGSDVVRINPSTQGFLSNNNVGGFANYLSGTNQFTNQRGGLLRRVGLPENLVFVNPQFANPMLVGNFSNSSYQALQVELVKRYSAGWTLQGNYTWSKNLGDYEGEDTALGSNYRTLRNMKLDKRLLSYSRAHVIRSNVIWELPFGPGKMFAKDAHGLLGRVVGGWQIGAINVMSTGQPIDFGAVNALNTFSGATPVVVGPLSSLNGSVQRTGNGVIYFTGLKQVPDPFISNITTVQGIQGRSAMLAVTDASGRLLLVNPAPGQFGTLGPRTIEGPGFFRLDLNVIKRIRINERFELHLRADAINATNTPQFSNPNTDINSSNFGRITGTTSSVSEAPMDGNRIVVVGLRLNF